MCKFLGLPGPTATPEQVAKYQSMQRLKAARSLPAAINMARLNALARGAHASSGSGNVIYDAFRCGPRRGARLAAQNNSRVWGLGGCCRLSEPLASCAPPLLCSVAHSHA